ncbi:SMI1/KNR4 family protein [Tenacibaculum sp. A30]|uniref:SMI1/KNR4 family protein n=1 Tax=Tenacibaculum sp. A30 TaxID=3442644 RepID=UPI003EBC7735
MKYKILKRGFELLRTRPMNEMVSISEIEAEYGVEVPPIFREFSKMFDVGQVQNQVKYVYGNNREQYCGGIVYCPEGYQKDKGEVMFYNFHTLEATVSGFEDDEDWEEAGHLPIAMCGHGGAILLGTKGSEIDCILLQTMSQKVYRISNNIFDFVRDLVMIATPEEELYEGIKYNQLYKNWGEGFWRVKKDENSL